MSYRHLCCSLVMMASVMLCRLRMLLSDVTDVNLLADVTDVTGQVRTIRGARPVIA